MLAQATIAVIMLCTARYAGVPPVEPPTVMLVSRTTILALVEKGGGSYRATGNGRWVTDKNGSTVYVNKGLRADILHTIVAHEFLHELAHRYDFDLSPGQEEIVAKGAERDLPHCKEYRALPPPGA